MVVIEVDSSVICDNSGRGHTLWTAEHWCEWGLETTLTARRGFPGLYGKLHCDRVANKTGILARWTRKRFCECDRLLYCLLVVSKDFVTCFIFWSKLYLYNWVVYFKVILFSLQNRISFRLSCLVYGIISWLWFSRCSYLHCNCVRYDIKYLKLIVTKFLECDISLLS